MKSDEQHKLDGTFQKCRHGDTGTNLDPVKNLTPPKSLKLAKPIWVEQVGALCEASLVTVADYPLLADAFDNLELALALQNRIEDRGGTVEYLDNLQNNQVNLVREKQNAMKIYKDIMYKFGVTAVNAQKVRGIKKDNLDTSSVTALFGNG